MQSADRVECRMHIWVHTGPYRRSKIKSKYPLQCWMDTIPMPCTPHLCNPPFNIGIEVSMLDCTPPPSPSSLILRWLMDCCPEKPPQSLPQATLMRRGWERDRKDIYFNFDGGASASTLMRRNIWIIFQSTLMRRDIYFNFEATLKKDKINKCSSMLLRIVRSFDVLLIWSDWTKCRCRVRL